MRDTSNDDRARYQPRRIGAGLGAEERRVAAPDGPPDGSRRRFRPQLVRLGILPPGDVLNGHDRGCGGQADDRLSPVKTLTRGLQARAIAAWFLGATVTAQAYAIAATPVATAANAERQSAIAAQGLVFQTSVTPGTDEDLAAACR